MLIGDSSVFKIVNDFSRQLFLIKTPADFNKGLMEAFTKVIPEIDLFVVFRLHWEDDTFSIISSNYLSTTSDIQIDSGQLKSLLHEYIRQNKCICNEDIGRKRDGQIPVLLNSRDHGSEVILPMIPVNDPVGLIYIYSGRNRFFDSEKLETFQFISNMIARTLNLINYQAHQIKSHKKAELEVINQKNFMNEIFDYLPINIFIKDNHGKYIYLNKNAEESTGVKLKDALGKTAFDIYSAETAKKLEADDLEVRQTKKPLLSQHEIVISGRPRHVFTGKKIIYTTANEELLIGFSIDITQNIQASQTIDDQKKFYQQIFNTVPNYIYVKDKSGRFLLVNEAFTKLFNLTQNQILIEGRLNPEEYELDAQLNAEIDQKVIESGETVEFEESLVLKNGEKRWYHTTKKPLPDKAGAVNILGISVDITDRKKHSDELIKAKQTKEQFLANMSHEIRTPINGIVGMINLLEEIPATEEQKKYLSAIKTSSENLQVIINDILDLSAIESGNIRFEQIGFNLRSLLTSLISSFNYSAKQKGISITLNFDPYIDEVLIGDPVRLNQVLSNLVGNAVKFTKRGFVKVYALKIGQESGTGIFQFIVDDSGIGIPENKIDLVFENFEQGDVTINRKYGGTGLGLAIVKQLVEAQKGKIDVKSKPGKGTKFTVELKFAIGTKENLNEEKKELTKTSYVSEKLDLSKYKVLLVEDNEVNILYTKKILNNWNCIPEEARNGLIALEKLKDVDYDLILMDVRMPVMDGFEASKFIRQNFQKPKSDTPIIALTANAIKGDEQKCIDAGMNDYISKPFQPETLKNKIISNMNLTGITKKITPHVSIADSNPAKVTDLSYLKEMSDNDSKFVLDMVQSFIHQTPKDIENIWFHFYNEEYENVANLVHKIKPSITFMGIHNLRDLVLEIEDNAKKKRLDPLEKQLKIFDETCQKAFEELKTEIGVLT